VLLDLDSLYRSMTAKLPEGVVATLFTISVSMRARQHSWTQGKTNYKSQALTPGPVKAMQEVFAFRRKYYTESCSAQAGNSRSPHVPNLINAGLSMFQISVMQASSQKFGVYTPKNWKPPLTGRGFPIKKKLDVTEIEKKWFEENSSCQN